nr:MAG TPA: hypothetical protein [Caudoviricetes sp.]
MLEISSTHSRASVCGSVAFPLLNFSYARRSSLAANSEERIVYS